MTLSPDGLERTTMGGESAECELVGNAQAYRVAARRMKLNTHQVAEAHTSGAV